MGAFDPRLSHAPDRWRRLWIKRDIGADVLALAAQIIAAQQAEIDAMHALVGG